MDCAACATQVQRALTKVTGVAAADVLLSAEKAIVQLDPHCAGEADLRRAVGAGRLPRASSGRRWRDA